MVSNMLLALDFSVTSPCIAYKIGESWYFHFLTSKKHLQDLFISGKYFFRGHPYPEWSTPEERYDRISHIFMKVVDKLDFDKAVFEEYAFSRSGRMTDIAENTGLMKHRLYQKNISISALSSTLVKKHATGKGNAKKPQMIAAFKQATGVDLYDILSLKEGLATEPAPIPDIADAYWVYQTALN